MPTDSISGSSALSTALQGIQRELKSVSENAEKIAGFGLSEEPESGDSLVNAIVDLKQDVNQVAALRKVVTAVDETEDEVLNIIA